MPRPSAALVVASIALFLALGGTSYAVTQLPRNSVGTAQLKKDAVTSTKIKDGAIATADLSQAARAELKGAKGDTGAPGATGAQGAPGSQGTAGAQGDPGPTASAAASQVVAVPVTSSWTPVGSTTITTTFASRLQIVGTVQFARYSNAGTPTVTLTIECVAVLNGASAGISSKSTLQLNLVTDNIYAAIPVAAGAEAAAGTHTVGLECRIEPGPYTSTNTIAWDLSVIAAAR